MGATYRDDHIAEGSHDTDRSAGLRDHSDGSSAVGDERRAGRTALPVAAQLTMDVTLGLVARVVLALATAYRTVDEDTFAAWARVLHDHPLGAFYAVAPLPDHLPGDLWLLDAVQGAFTAAGGTNFDGAAFGFLTNAVPMVADVVVGVLLFLLVRRWASPEVAARAARWYLLNPAVIVLAGVWGQWDSVSMALVLVGLLLLGSSRAWIGAAPAMAWAVLVKPQLAVAAAILSLWVVMRRNGGPSGARETRSTLRSRALARMGAFGALGLLTSLVLLQPFRVGLAWTPHGGSSLVARLRYAADLHEYTTMGAANLWMVLDRDVIGPSDVTARWAGMTAATIGVGLFAVLGAVVALTAGRAFPSQRRLESLVWGAAAATFAACLVLTRVHERYYFAVLVLLLVWCGTRGLDRLSAWLFWVFTGLFAIDLVVPMGWTGHDHGLLHRPVVLVVLGLLHLGLFGVLLVVPWRARSTTGLSITAGARSAPTDARRTGPG